MTHIKLAALLCLGVAAFAQEVQFDYDRSANFAAYKTYQWVDYNPVQIGDQLLDQDIKRAVDAELAGKGLVRVESGGDLRVGYWQRSHRRSSLTASALGDPNAWGNWGNTRVTSSTIEIGKLVIGIFDPATNKLVWRGAAAKTLDVKKDPDKNYRNLEKAMAKLFKNYPPGVRKS